MKPTFTVRAKFYVSAINKESNQPYNDQAPFVSDVVHLAASYSQDPDSENFKFWTASPSGKCSIVLDEKSGFPPDFFELSKFYYIDMVPAAHDAEDPDVWWVQSVNQIAERKSCEPGQVDVVLLGADNWRTRFEISIRNKAVMDYYKLGGRYRVAFSKAES